MTEQIKTMNIRLPFPLWKWLKQQSVDEDTSMVDIVKRSLEQYQSRVSSGAS